MPSDPTPHSAPDRQVRQACAELDRRLRAGESARTEDYLGPFAASFADDSTALELAYTEFVAREELGQRPSPEEWYARFPRLRRDLHEMFQIHELMREGIDDALPVASALAAVGDDRRLGHFEIIEEVGRGGAGVVYKARDLKLGRVVALKVIPAMTEAGPDWERFRAEAEAAASLQHPQIVQIYETGVSAGRPFLSLEFVAGGSLGRYLRGRPQDVRGTARLVEGLARAAHYAHQRGVIHRDLKPANVLLTPDGTAKITDFGLAQLRDAAATGAVQGTPGYMAPEQLALPALLVGPPADVYALGAILYEMLTGRPPTGDGRDLGVLLAETPRLPPIPSHMRRVPPDLDAVCLRCLEPDPARRYPSAEDMAEDLRRFLAGEPVQARPVHVGERAWMWARRRPAVAALAAVSAAAALGLVGGTVRYQADLRAALHQAERAQAKAERHAEELQEQLLHSRRGLYALQLSQVDSLWRHDPGQGRRLLDDRFACPPELRDFTWGYYSRLCHRERLSLRCGAGVNCLAVSPDGRTLAAGGGNPRAHAGVVELWDLAAGRATVALTGHVGPVNAVAFSPDGRTLAAASGNRQGERGEVSLWDVATGRLLRAHEDTAGPVLAVAFSPDGAVLASGGADRHVRLWDAATGADKASLAVGLGKPVQCLAFSPDGTTLAAGGSSAALLDLSTGRRRALLAVNSGTTSLSYSPDGTLLATAGQDRAVVLWDAATGQKVAALTGHTNAVQCVAFSRDGTTLATSSADQTVRLWDVGSRRETTTLQGHDGAVDCVAFAPDGRTFACGGRGGVVKVWDTDAAAPWRSVRGHGAKVLCAAFSPDGATLATGGQDAAVKLWDAAGRPRGDLRGHRRAVRAVAFHPNGRLLAAGDEDNTIRLWDLDRGWEGLTLTGHTQYVAALAFTPDGRALVSCGRDHTVRVWDPLTGHPRLTLDEHRTPLFTLAFTRDGKCLATAGQDGVVKLWDTASWRVRAALPAQPLPVQCLAFHPDGKILATGCRDQTIRLWGVDDAQEKLVLRGHTHWVYSLSFSGDGRTLASASGDRYSNAPGEVKLWDAVSGHVRATFPGQVAPVVFSPDGRTLLTANNDGTANVLEAVSNELQSLRPIPSPRSGSPGSPR